MAPLSREEYIKRHMRLVWAMVAQFALTVLAVGFLLTAYAGVQHDKCVDNLHRTQEAARLLPRIVAASEADGDMQTAAFWNDYLVQLRKAPPAQC